MPDNCQGEEEGGGNTDLIGRLTGEDCNNLQITATFVDKVLLGNVVCVRSRL